MMFSGTDMSPAAINDNKEIALNLTRQIAEQVDCTQEATQAMVDCLRTRSSSDIGNTTWDYYVRDCKDSINLCVHLIVQWYNRLKSPTSNKM